MNIESLIEDPSARQSAEDYLQRVRRADGGYDEDGLRCIIDALISGVKFTQDTLEEIEKLRQLNKDYLCLVNQNHALYLKTEAELQAAREELEEIANQKPAAWMNPSIVTFEGAKRTNCPPELQEKLEGTVAWGLDQFDGPDEPVTDKFGVEHHPYPLGRIPSTSQASDK